MLYKKLLFIVSMFATVAMGFESDYTSLVLCKIKEKQTHVTYKDCGKINDINIVVEETNRTKSITLIHHHKSYPQKYEVAVSYDPIVALGKKIEWRYRYKNSNSPLAMIVRVDVNEDKGQKQEKHSYLVVSRVDKHGICVVGKISSQRHQNEMARKMADIASELPCVLNMNSE